MYTILLVIHTIIVVFLILMVLIQRSDSDGMSGLGGGGGNQFLTGRGQANLMTRTTAILATAFMATSLALAIMGSRMGAGSIVDAVPVESSIEKVDQPVGKPDAKVDTKAAAVPKDNAPKATKVKTPAPASEVPKPE